MQEISLEDVQSKWSVIFIDRFWAWDIDSVVNEWTSVTSRERAFKSTWLLDAAQQFL